MTQRINLDIKHLDRNQLCNLSVNDLFARVLRLQTALAEANIQRAELEQQLLTAKVPMSTASDSVDGSILSALEAPAEEILAEETGVHASLSGLQHYADRRREAYKDHLLSLEICNNLYSNCIQFLTAERDYCYGHALDNRIKGDSDRANRHYERGDRFNAKLIELESLHKAAITKHQ